MEANPGLALGTAQPRGLRHRLSTFSSRPPHADSDGSLEDPFHHFTSSRFGLAGRRAREIAARRSQVLPKRAPPGSCVAGSARPLPQGVLHSPGRTQAQGWTAKTARASSRQGRMSAAPGHPYLTLDQLHHFGCRGEGNHKSSCRIRWKGIRCAERSLQSSVAPAFSL